MDLVEAEIKEIRIADPTEELSQLKVEIEASAAQKAALEVEIQGLLETKKKAEDDLLQYQQKYRLR